MATVLGFSGLGGAILALLFGILVLSFPKFLRYLVGIYLIILGILGLIGWML